MDKHTIVYGTVLSEDGPTLVVNTTQPGFVGFVVSSRDTFHIAFVDLMQVVKIAKQLDDWVDVQLDDLGEWMGDNETEL